MVAKNLKTVDIKGKKYVEVSERIKYFRETCQGWSIITKIIEYTPERVLMRADVTDDKGSIVSTGHAYEDANNGFINKTSYIENCETSAVGRALGFLGIGIDDSVASALEVVNAINNKEKVMHNKVCAECGSPYSTSYSTSTVCYPCYLKKNKVKTTTNNPTPTNETDPNDLSFLNMSNE
jgi:hypothetical protein